jgi:pimeloyl-ACP methyl ester carboxylesterase
MRVNPAFLSIFIMTICSGVCGEQPFLSNHPSIDGLWEGALEHEDIKLYIMVEFETDGEYLRAYMDAPEQRVSKMPLYNISFRDDRIRFEALAGKDLALFDGILTNNSTISGELMQRGVLAMFHLDRVEENNEKLVPYKEEEVAFHNGNISLSGTLTLPSGDGPYPAVILITGSGAQNRDEELLGFKPFAVIADNFTRQGIAVLRYDDRGVGGSTGSIINSTSEDFAGDVLAGVELLKMREDVHPEQIGLLGHSEGGVVASIAASRSEDVAFIILLAPTTVTGDQILLAQGELIMRAEGASEEDIINQQNFQLHTIEAIRTGENWQNVKMEFLDLLEKQMNQTILSQNDSNEDFDQYADELFELLVRSKDNPWFHFFLDYDPSLALENVTVPVLALFGELDLQVPADMNIKPLEDALEKAGNEDVTIITIPGANHLFQTAESGSPSEYVFLKKEFAPGVLDTMTGWTLERV